MVVELLLLFFFIVEEWIINGKFLDILFNLFKILFIEKKLVGSWVLGIVFVILFFIINFLFLFLIVGKIKFLGILKLDFFSKVNLVVFFL